MPEEKDVVLDEELEESTQDIQNTEDSETSEESSPKETEGKEETGEVEKTQGETQEPSDEEVEKQLLKEGADIPYSRFKSFVDKRNIGNKTWEEKFSKLQKDLEESKSYLDNPKVYRAISENRGLTKEKITEEMKRAGFDVKEDVPQSELDKKFAEGIDFNTREGWNEYNRRQRKHEIDAAVSPIMEKIAQRERDTYLQSQKEEAKKLAKDIYKIEFGKTRQDEGNPNTAVGKISAYLEKNPTHATFGWVPLLKLAMEGEGFTLAKDKGVQQEKDRLKALKNSQMEGDEFTGKREGPTSNESTEKVLDYARKNPKSIDDYFNT